ncbi:MAG: type VII secretion protein EccB [Mycolicibacterium insubricum]|nr:type VII secretion protein EccB [Mycobacterium sp.]
MNHASGDLRFLRRRAAAALRPPDNSGPALTAGAVLTAVLLATRAVDLLGPAPTVGDAAVVMSADTGARYVRIGDTVHPVLNLTSARLIADNPAAPRRVSAAALAGTARGATLGIPGAPDDVGTPLPTTTWAVCDNIEATTVLIDQRPPAGDSAALVTGPSGRRYLLTGGHRHEVAADPGVNRALGVDAGRARPVSAALLALLPAGSPITPVRVPLAGNPGPAALGNVRVGEVIGTERAGARRYYLVLAGGVAPIGALAADLLRFTGGDPGARIRPVSAAALAAVPTAALPAVAGLPEDVGAIDTRADGVLCAGRDADGAARTWVADAPPLPPGRHAVALAGADGPGPAVDAVFVPPGRCVYLSGPDGRSVLTDTGVRYPVDDDAARVLALGEHPLPAPPGLTAGLPTGPTLNRAAAAVAH